MIEAIRNGLRFRLLKLEIKLRSTLISVVCHQEQKKYIPINLDCLWFAKAGVITSVGKPMMVNI